ncbi:uncharacterized mitochondrial protein AtMg00810-like [Amaranthus tricolor]|uniref:uncharacterized mitochondrial protein AtMg00810-like n=1 Tax=Amaranthus tricolor TaxID=29722 RepID=UPI002587DC82|nr:uncharacterized mitochondrial protein AtMg00810-like [Amaranthus tricolor]
MKEEFDALIENHTWDLVPRPPHANIIRSLWVFRVKTKSDGSFERYKARLVGDGKSQREGIDCDETFSPVVKPTSIRIPLGFRDPTRPSHVCLLRKSLYGLKQAPRAWYQRFTTFATTIGFSNSISDNSLFVYCHGSNIAYLLLYVDDIILTASSDSLRESIMSKLSSEFAIKDLGPLNYLLGIAVTPTSTGLFLSQQRYASEILEKDGMSQCNPVATSVATSGKLCVNAGSPCEDPTLYRSLAGALQYLTFTRPDISYAVQQVCLYMHDPRIEHMAAIHRILRYVKGTLPYGLQLHRSNISTLLSYTDADWGGCPDTRRSTSGYCVFLGDNLNSWSAKRQTTVSKSSAAAEYRGVANVVSETFWIRNLLLELHCPITTATLVYCENISAVYLAGEALIGGSPNEFVYDFYSKARYAKAYTPIVMSMLDPIDWKKSRIVNLTHLHTRNF